MIINMSTFSKGLIIALVYIMKILTVLCNDTNKLIRDYDLLRINDNGNYNKYHFRNPDYPGQLKMRPTGIFRTFYSCEYNVLPDIESSFDYKSYIDEYKEKINLIESRRNDLINELTKIKDEEYRLVEEFKKANEATKNAYDIVLKYDELNQDEKKNSQEEKDNAISNYLLNRMPDISEKTFSSGYCVDKFKYSFENYEYYNDPTEEEFYQTRIIEAELNIIESSKLTSCKPLNENEYNIVQLYYILLPKYDIIVDQETEYYEFKKRKFDLISSLQDNSYKLTIKSSKDDLKKLENSYNPDDISHTFNRVQGKFVVNNENYMSYLVRMKKLGYVGFFKNYHSFLYQIRKNNYLVENIDDSEGQYFIDMDIHTESFETENLEEIKPKEI